MAATKNLGPEAAKQTVELTEESIQMILALKVKVLQFCCLAHGNILINEVIGADRTWIIVIILFSSISV